jgi:hypothetical protein
MLRILAVLFALLLMSIAIVLGVGYALPQAHLASRAISLRQKSTDVFALISNFKDGASWRSGIREVEILAPANGHIVFRERGPSGVLTYEVIALEPTQRLVTRIADKNLPFGGTWTFETFPTSEGTRLNITERGEIYNPVFRFVSRFILGYNRTLDTYLQDVSRKFGENAVPQAGTPSAQ